MPARLHHPLTSTGFVGRHIERGQLDEALQQATSGHGHVVIVGGEAGVGKTRLAERFAQDADAAGARVLTGWCVELGTEGLPLAPFTTVLRELIRELGTDALSALLPGWTGLAPLLPELGAALGRAEPASEPRLFQVLSALLDRLSAERPVLLVIEDLHWSDRSTRDLLGLLARGLRDARILTLVTHRTDAVPRGHPLRSFLGELERLHGARRIELGRFSLAETRELIARTTGEQPVAALVDLIFRRSGGNAFFVQELLRAQRATAGPGLNESLRDLLLSRVEQLPGPAQQVVRVAAVGGQRTTHRLLAAVADLPADALLDGLRSAVDGHVLVAERDGYAFQHALVREAVLGDLLPGERQGLHLGYVEALEREPDLVAPDRLAAEIAHHCAIACPPARALPALLRAADAAESVHAQAEQCHLLVRALELWPHVPDAERPAGTDRLGLLERAAVAAFYSGEHEHTLDLVDQAITAADPDRDPERAAVLLARRGRFLFNLGRPGSLATVEEAERLVPAGASPSAARGTVLEILGMVLVMHGNLAGARQVFEEALRLARQQRKPPLEVFASAGLGMTLVYSGHHEQGLATLQEARALAERSRFLPGLVRVYLQLAVVLGELGRHDDAIAAARTGLAVPWEPGWAGMAESYLAGYLAASLVAVGRWEEADERIAKALDLNPPGTFAVRLLIVRGELAVARGELAAARADADRARAALRPGHGLSRYALLLALLDAEIALREHRVDDARQVVASTLEAARLPNATAYAWPLLTVAARVEAHAHALAGTRRDRAGAGRLLEDLREVAAGLPTGTPAWQAHAAQFAAELDSLPTASPTWGEVVAAWDKAGQPYPAAYARLRAAEAALAARDRTCARRWLRTAAETAGSLGAIPLLHQVRQVAGAAGIRLDTEREPEPDAAPPDELQRLGLTPRERQVLRLLTEGRSNRQIATGLFISEKTASVHVSRILTKLGAASRGQAAAIAHRLRLFADDPPG